MIERKEFIAFLLLVASPVILGLLLGAGIIILSVSAEIIDSILQSSYRFLDWVGVEKLGAG